MSFVKCLFVIAFTIIVASEIDGQDVLEQLQANQQTLINKGKDVYKQGQDILNDRIAQYFNNNNHNNRGKRQVNAGLPPQNDEARNSDSGRVDCLNNCLNIVRICYQGQGFQYGNVDGGTVMNSPELRMCQGIMIPCVSRCS